MCSELPFFHVDEQLEVAVSAAIEKDVMGKWIDPKNPAADIKREKSLIKTHAGEFGNFSRHYNSCFF